MTREEQSSNMRKKIIKSAIMLYGKKGYNGTTIEEISKNIGVSKGIIYHYFNNKDDLYLVCVDNLVADFLDYLENEFNGGNGFDFKTAKTAHEIKDEFLSRHSEYTNFFNDIIFNKPEHLKEEMKKRKKPIIEMNSKIHALMLSDIKFGKGVELEDALISLSLMQYALPVILNNEDIVNSEEHLHKMFRIFINGLTVDME